MAACSHTCIHSSLAFPCITRTPIWQALDGGCEAVGLLQAFGQVWRGSKRSENSYLPDRRFLSGQIALEDEKIFPFTGQNRRTTITVEAQCVTRAKKS